MSIYFYTIAKAAAHSRTFDQIATVRMEDWDIALNELHEAVREDEESDYVKNGNVLEFWCYDPDSDDANMTMRVHVERTEKNANFY